MSNMRSLINIIEGIISEMDANFDSDMDKIHSDRWGKFWATPDRLDFILPRGIHDDLCYRRFAEPGDDNVNPDSINWVGRAIKNGWLRCTMTKGGRELNIDIAKTAAARASVMFLKPYLMNMDMLQMIRIDVYDLTSIRSKDESYVAPQALVFDDPQKAFAALTRLSR